MAAPPDDLAADLRLSGFVEITPDDGVVLDIRYATANNFLGRDLYDGFDRLFLHPVAAEKLRRAIAVLRRTRPDWRLLMFDGLRPNRIQRQMWAAVEGTPQQPYVGNPAVGSIHGFGFAIDLSLQDATGREVDMGTPFDAFAPLSEPRLEAAFLASGDLTASQVHSRELLRGVMGEAGFQTLPIEWWHFDALPVDAVRRSYRLVE